MMDVKQLARLYIEASDEHEVLMKEETTCMDERVDLYLALKASRIIKLDLENKIYEELKKEMQNV